MRADLAAALRLASALPVHTHERKPPVAPVNLGNRSKHRGRGVTVVFGRGGKARKVRIGATVYDTVTDAARTRRKSTRTIYEWLRDGRAEYV